MLIAAALPPKVSLMRYATLLVVSMLACLGACDGPTTPIERLRDAEQARLMQACEAGCWEGRGFSSLDECYATLPVVLLDQRSCEERVYDADLQTWIECRAAALERHVDCLRDAECTPDSVAACDAALATDTDACPLPPPDALARYTACSPDADRDGDSVPNAEDLCPDEPESPDGYVDEDGCPDARYGPCTLGRCEEGDVCHTVMGGGLCTRSCEVDADCPSRGTGGVCLSLFEEEPERCYQSCVRDQDCEPSSTCEVGSFFGGGSVMVCLPAP